MPHYLDHAATSPIRPEVLEGYYEELKTLGNPASVHSFGQQARKTLEESREQLAKLVNCDRNEIIFTSGGTESDNLAIKGLYWQRHGEDPKRTLIITSAAEHHAVIDPVDWLIKEQGAEAAYVPLSSEGALDLQYLEDLLQQRHSEVAFISLMWANNEIGVINPIQEIVKIANRFNLPVHSDAIAAFGHIPVDFKSTGLSVMSITGHKIGSPVGIGALVVSRKTKLVSVLHGGGQERNLRSGTPDAAAAKAFAIAATSAVDSMDTHMKSLRVLRDKLIEGTRLIAPDAILSGESQSRLPDNAHFRFPGCSGDSLLFLMDISEVSISTGSACTAGVAGPSHVVLAMGLTEDEASGCLRATLGHNTTLEDIDAYLIALPAAYEGAKKAGLSRNK